MKLINLLLLILFISCSQSNHKNELKNDIDKPSEIKYPSETMDGFKEPINFSYDEIAKYTIVSIMFQQESNIMVEKKKDRYIASYNKDGKKNSFKIKFIKNKIIWGNEDGKWRDQPHDEKIIFEEKDSKLLITQIWSDGSSSTDEYYK